MGKNYKAFENELSRQHRFGFFKKPNYEKTIEVKLDEALCEAVIQKAVELLGWRLLSVERGTIVARSTEKWGTHGRIEISYMETNRIRVKSESWLDQRWDLGRNSIRVQLFIEVFREAAEKLTEGNKEQVSKLQRVNFGLYDYKIPEHLPSPTAFLKTRKWVPVVFGLIVSVILGVFAGYLSYLDLFVAFTKELILGFSLWIAIVAGAKLGNYLKISGLLWISLACVGVFFLITELSIYFFEAGNEIFQLSVFQYSDERLNELFGSHKLSKILIGMIIYFGIFLLIGSSFVINLKTTVSEYERKKIPKEVIELVRYFIINKKTTQQIRIELSKRGWNKKETQDLIFKTVATSTNLG